MFTVDAALERTCADFREQAARGEITAAERDLLIDGAILLAVSLDELIQDARAGSRQAGPMPVSIVLRGSWRPAGTASAPASAAARG